MPQQSHNGPARFSSRSRTTLLTTKMRQPWRRRAICVVHKKTHAEKKALADKRRQHRKTYSEALHDASQAIKVQAVQMKEKFGAHSADYYEKEIMQCSRLARSKRSINRWNVYLRSETKRMNDCEYSVYTGVY